MILFLITTTLFCQSNYYLHHQDGDPESATCDPAAPCSSLDLFETLVENDTSTVNYAADVTLHVFNYAELIGNVHIGGYLGTMDIKFLGESNDGVLQGSGTITFDSNATCIINVLFAYMKIWSYHVVDGEWQTSLIACVDNTNVEFENCTIADFASHETVELPPRYVMSCVWDGQIAAVRVANTKVRVQNTTFDGICLGGLALRNALPWTEPAPGDPTVVLDLNVFLFRANRWPQPTTDGVRAYIPVRNLFVLSQSDEVEVRIHKGHADFDGGEDLSTPLEIYDRGAIFVTDVDEPGVYREFKVKRTEPSFESTIFSVRRGTTRENTIISLTVTGTSIFRCGSNTLAISPYFKDAVPDNPTWLGIPIVGEHGMEKIVGEVKSSDVWPAQKWLLRTTIAGACLVFFCHFLLNCILLTLLTDFRLVRCIYCIVSFRLLMGLF
ncbi:hypothetical protein BLNAU_14225 [Blattamonas nauphoetae]|uniref:Uncharacterized protein n=1 Tax=Blattamonas nauphoetae TaxID=2049346 RepID=A0ABQ9XHJ5_9EUKA|nr:hypothetical protein BLNAU_14225 [Blattamonas nauphoetae]